MNRKKIAASLLAVATVAALPVAAFAQRTQDPVPDRNGDYNSIQRLTANGKVINGSKGEHRSWRVVSTNLNCRSTPGVNNPIVRRFTKEQLIEAASFGRGGADEVIVIQRDAKGKPWMRVNLKPGQCFVRANSRYIEPNSLE